MRRKVASGILSGATAPPKTVGEKSDGWSDGVGLVGILSGANGLPRRGCRNRRVRFSEDPPETKRFTVESGLTRKVARNQRAERRLERYELKGFRVGGIISGTTCRNSDLTSPNGVRQNRSLHGGMRERATVGGRVVSVKLSEVPPSGPQTPPPPPLGAAAAARLPPPLGAAAAVIKVGRDELLCSLFEEVAESSLGGAPGPLCHEGCADDSSCVAHICSPCGDGLGSSARREDDSSCCARNVRDGRGDAWICPQPKSEIVRASKDGTERMDSEWLSE